MQSLENFHAGEGRFPQRKKKKRNNIDNSKRALATLHAQSLKKTDMKKEIRIEKHNKIPKNIKIK